MRAGMPKDTVLIELGENLGVAAANNAGMEYALSHDVDWTLLLNNDATVERGVPGPVRGRGDGHAARRHPRSGRHLRRPAPSALVRGGQRERLVCLPASPRLAPARSLPATELRRGLRVHLLRPRVFGCIPVARPLSGGLLHVLRRDRVVSASQSRRLEVPLSGRGSLRARRQCKWGPAREPGDCPRTWPTTSLAILCGSHSTPRRPLRRISRVVGLLTVYAAFNAWRTLKSRQWAIASAYVQGLADALRGRMGKRPSR